MLPPAARLRRREDFTDVLRHGRRTSRGGLVVHLLRTESSDAESSDAESSGAGSPGVEAPNVESSDAEAPARVGLVVGKAVGNAVRRHEVSRRLRHLMRTRLDRLGSSDRVVLRALPPAVGRSSAELGADLDRALTRLGVR